MRRLVEISKVMPGAFENPDAPRRDGSGPRIGSWPRDWGSCDCAATVVSCCRRSTRCSGTGPASDGSSASTKVLTESVRPIAPILMRQR